MINDGGLTFGTQLKIEFLPPNNSSKKCLEKSQLRQLSLNALSRWDCYKGKIEKDSSSCN